MSALPGPLARVIEELRKLPGIGPKSAQRLALHLVRRPPDEIAALVCFLSSEEAGYITGETINANGGIYMR